MDELTARYQIHGKKVLSVGTGTSREEKHFTEKGNHLTIVDIDEHGRILPVLKTIPE
jgi:ubiquinone/menaquinone biosynthesis C-methylase UbiE